MDSENTSKSSIKSEIGDEIIFTSDSYEHYSLAAGSSTNNDSLVEVKAEPEKEYYSGSFVEIKTEPEEHYWSDKDNVKEFSFRLTSTLKESETEYNEGISQDGRNIENIKRQWTCTVCEQSFSTLKILRDHVRIHLKNEVQYKEEVYLEELDFKEEGNSVPCKESISRSLPAFNKIHPDDLVDFEKTLVDKKPLHCTVCGEKFSIRYQLKDHMKTHKGEKTFVCNVCNKRFSENYNLKRHSKIHTGEKPFICKECNQTFSQKAALKIHMRVHTGEKPYVCDVCFRRFSLNSGLKTHRRIHTGERPYVCEVCCKRFYKNSNLRRHVKTH